jgi:hypothetical protein
MGRGQVRCQGLRLSDAVGFDAMDGIFSRLIMSGIGMGRLGLTRYIMILDMALHEIGVLEYSWEGWPFIINIYIYVLGLVRCGSTSNGLEFSSFLSILRKGGSKFFLN